MKRLLAIFVCLSMVLTCIAGITFTASAAVITDAGILGSGTADDPYIIDNAAKFIAVFGSGNTETETLYASGVVYHLTADIDLSEGYAPNDAAFQGTLKGADQEGNGVKREINLGTKNYSDGVEFLVSTTKYYTKGALFTQINGATVSYLTLRGDITFSNASHSRTAALVGFATGTSTISYIDNYAKVTGKVETGGIVGRLDQNANLSHCVNYGEVEGTKGGVGGVIGLRNGLSAGTSSSVDNCGNRGNVTSTSHTGGIAGYAYTTMKRCYNTGNVETTSDGALAGGIVGYTATKGIKMVECWNSGTITATASTAAKSGAGGIIGGDYTGKPARNTHVENCFNVGVINGGRRAAANGNIYFAGGSFKGFYDIVNADIDLYATGSKKGSETVESAYILGSKTSSLTGLTYTNYATIKGLTLGSDPYFSDSSVWTIAEGYSYPQLVNNPYFGNDILEPQGNVFERNEIAGSGTEADPYIVDTANKFKALFSSSNIVASDLALTHADNVYFLQTEDLTIGAFAPTNETFKGVYRGGSIDNGVTTLANKVLDVTIDGGSTEGVAIFPQYEGATFSHITVEGSVKGGKYTGSIAGEEPSIPTGGSQITNIINRATINGTSHSAGIVGMIRKGGTITNCVNEAAVTCTSGYIGGIVGWANTAITIENCHNSGTITAGSSYAGGMAGVAYASSFTNCSNTGDVTSTASTGGITGGLQSVLDYDAATYNTISGCWNSGDISATATSTGAAAGIVALTIRSTNTNPAVVLTNNFNAGKVIAASDKEAGLVYQIGGKDDGQTGYTTTINGFYDATSKKDAIGAIDSTVEASTVSIANLFTYNYEETQYTYSEYATEADIKALIANEKLSADDWQINATYGIPELKANPYTGDNSKLFPLPEFAGGTGVVGDEYLVANAYHFSNVEKYPTAHFKQTGDFKVEETVGAEFTGTYDGNGHTIELAINTGIVTNDGVGLFTQLGANGVIKNLTTTGSVKFTDSALSYVGAIVGIITGTGATVTNCVNYADVTNSSTSTSANTTGIIGRAYQADTTITYCTNYGDITSAVGYTSGIYTIGRETGCTMSNLANFGDITSTSTSGSAGGIVSWGYCGLSNSYNFGKITAPGCTAGGVAGSFVRNATITNCFNAGQVIGETVVDFGSISSGKTLTLENSYSTASNTDIATGAGTKTISNCYKVAEGASEVAGVTNVTKDALKVQAITGFSLAADNAENDKYNKSYPYPQITSNLIPASYVYVEPVDIFAGGTGTEEDPYKVSNAAQFANVKDYPTAHFIQTANFEVTDILWFTNTAPFSGVYDGDGKTITVKITTIEDTIGEFKNSAGTIQPAIGLFRVLKGTIKNLTIDGYFGTEESRIDAVRIGAFTSTMNDGSIINCVNKANIYGSLSKGSEVSGFAGRNHSSGKGAATISNCVNYGSINSRYAAGITGVNGQTDPITNCVNYGLITATSYAAGMASWTYGPFTGCANFGTIKSDSTASGIITKLTNLGTANAITNCYNAGTLDAPNTFGIVHRDNDKAYNVTNCYNMVYADNPINGDGKTGLTAEVTVTGCYYLTADESAVAADGITPVTTLAGMEAINLGDAFSIKQGSAYIYPQITAVTLDEAKVGNGFAKITVSVEGDAQQGTYEVVNFPTETSFFVQKGFTLNVKVDPAGGFYQADVTAGEAQVGNGIIAETVIPLEANADKAIVITVSKIAVTEADVPAITTNTNIMPKYTTEAQEFDGATFTKYALIAGTAPVKAGFKLNEYGVIVGHSEFISINYNENIDYVWGQEGYARPYTFKAAITDKAKMNASGKYGALLYGDNLKAGVTYYVRAYAEYEDVNGNKYVVEGDAMNFTIPEVATAE